MTSDGPLVLLLAADPEPVVLVIGRLTHGAMVEGAVEAVVFHDIDQLSVTDACSPSQFPNHMRAVGHAFHAAGHDECRLSKTYCPVGESNCGHPGKADLVDRHGWHCHGQSPVDCGLTCRDLTFTCLKHVPEEDFVDRGGIDMCSLSGGGDGDASEFDSAQRFQRAVVFSYRCPGDSGDH